MAAVDCHDQDRSEQQLSSHAECVNGSCVPARSGGFCLVCGRSFNDGPIPPEVLVKSEQLLREDDESLGPGDPNYWVYLMHDLEIVAEPIAPQVNAGLAFYGRRPSRK
jgi:hypothetical protein